MEKIAFWYWIILLLAIRGLMEFVPILHAHDLYGLLVTSCVLMLVWRKLNHQEELLRPFFIGIWIYWFGYVFDYIDSIFEGQGYWGRIVDIGDDLLFAIGFFLIALAFLRVMNHRTRLINQLNSEVERSKTMQQALHLQAHSDELTGLGNRRALFECLEQKIRAGESGTVLYIDVNNFKPVNDRFGHDVGDLVLQRCAKKITHQGALAFRLGGDEFVAILGDQNPKAWIIELSKQAQLLAQEYGVTFSVGMAAFSPEVQLTPDELLSQADQQMYSEKLAEKKRNL